MAKNYNIILINFKKETRVFMLKLEMKSSFKLGEFRELTETIGQFLQDVVEKYLRR